MQNAIGPAHFLIQHRRLLRGVKDILAIMFSREDCLNLGGCNMLYTVAGAPATPARPNEYISLEPSASHSYHHRSVNVVATVRVRPFNLFYARQHLGPIQHYW